ncbi:MAG TPA: hypothetical protein VHK91_18055 [Flavisolibacter sp.]|nr:hypothetical protein [Flavisolibacter sp.]
MRKISAILLLGLLSLALCGYQLLFHIQRQEARKIMKQSLLAGAHSHDIIEFTFTEPQIQQLEWEEAGEFRMGDQLYDVLEQIPSSGHVTLRCLSDAREEAVLDQYRQVLEKQGRPSEKLPLVKLLTTPFLVQSPLTILTIVPVPATRAHFRNPIMPDVCRPVFSPPPKAA